MQVVRIVSAIVLARMLTETDFGLVSLVTIVTAFYDRVLGDTGTTAALVQLERITQGLASSVLWLNVAVGAIGTTVMITFAEPLAALLGERDAADLLRVVACIAVVSSFGYVPRALLRRRGEFRKLALANMMNAGITAGGSIVLAQAGWGEWSLAVGNLAGAAAFMLAAWLQIDWRPSLVFVRSEVRSISRFSVNLSASNLFGYISFAGDRFIVGRFLGVADLGYYGLANRLMRYPVQTSSQTYRDVIFPSLARLQGDRDEVGRVFGRSVAGIAFVLFPVCASVAALARPARRPRAHRTLGPHRRHLADHRRDRSAPSGCEHDGESLQLAWSI